MIATHIDVTERKRAQEEHERLRQLEADLAHVNRVSIMGELAASLAHEILHPIATARNNARAGMRYLEMSPPNLPEVEEALACIVRDADRAKSIVDRMRDHIKKAPPRSEPFDLNEAIDEVIEMVQSAITKNGVLVRTTLKGSLLVHGDRVQLQQVVLNLILNAIESMSSVEEERARAFDQHEARPDGECWSQCKIQGQELIRSVSIRFSRRSTPQRMLELEWDSRFAGPSSPLMEVDCGQRPTGLGARYFSSLCPQARRVHECSSCGFPDSRAERRQRSRCSSSTGLLR